MKRYLYFFQIACVKLLYAIFPLVNSLTMRVKNMIFRRVSVSDSSEQCMFLVEESSCNLRGGTVVQDLYLGRAFRNSTEESRLGPYKHPQSKRKIYFETVEKNRVSNSATIETLHYAGLLPLVLICFVDFDNFFIGKINCSKDIVEKEIPFAQISHLLTEYGSIMFNYSRINLINSDYPIHIYNVRGKQAYKIS